MSIEKSQVLIPYVVEQTGRGERGYDIYSRLLKDRLNEILALHTGKSVDAIGKDSDRDFFMSAAESRDYGLVDEVVKSRREEKRAEKTDKAA